MQEALKNWTKDTPQNPQIKPKTMSDYAKEFNSYGVVSSFNKEGYTAAVKKISEFIELKKTELLLAWWAMYGFDPGEAVLVHGLNEKGQCITGIRPRTPEETEMFIKAKTPSEKPSEGSAELPYYIIVRGEAANDVEEEVSECRLKGYKVSGNLVVVPNKDCFAYFQPMVRDING